MIDKVKMKEFSHINIFAPERKIIHRKSANSSFLSPENWNKFRPHFSDFLPGFCPWNEKRRSSRRRVKTYPRVTRSGLPMKIGKKKKSQRENLKCNVVIKLFLFIDEKVFRCSETFLDIEIFCSLVAFIVTQIDREMDGLI